MPCRVLRRSVWRATAHPPAPRRALASSESPLSDLDWRAQTGAAPGGRAMSQTRRIAELHEASLKGLHACHSREVARCAAREWPGRKLDHGLVIARVGDPDGGVLGGSRVRTARSPEAGHSRAPPSATPPNSATAPVAASASERSVVAFSEVRATGRIVSRAKHTSAELRALGQDAGEHQRNRQHRGEREHVRSPPAQARGSSRERSRSRARADRRRLERGERRQRPLSALPGSPSCRSRRRRAPGRDAGRAAEPPRPGKSPRSPPNT